MQYSNENESPMEINDLDHDNANETFTTNQTESATQQKQKKVHGQFKMIPLDDNLQDYPDHPFDVYEGDKLKKMTESVRENGVIQNILVRKIDEDNMQILSGHNRVKAAKKAGLMEIPAIIIDDLSDEDADILVNETNIEQRTLKNFSQTEKVKSISQYNNAIKQQGKKTERDLMFGQNDQKEENYARTKTARKYGVGESTVKRCLQLNKLIPELKNRLGDKNFKSTPAVNISGIPDNEQQLINSVLEKDTDKKISITMINSKELKELSEDKELTEEKIKEVLTKEADSTKPKLVKINMDTDKYSQLFADNPDPAQVLNEILSAVKFYRENNPETKDDDSNSDSKPE